MRQRLPKLCAAVFLLGLLSSSARGQPPLEKPSAMRFPDTLSDVARRYLESLPDPARVPAAPAADDVAGWKRAFDANEAANEPRMKAALERYQPTVTERKIGGVAVLDIKPRGWKVDGRVLVHAHGGGYTLNTARVRLQSSAAAADATGLRVISIDYTVAPGAKWPQVTDEVVAVFGGLRQEGFEPREIAAYGESAGGGLIAGAVLKMRDMGLPMPAAVVLWSPWADITDRGDSAITLATQDAIYRYEPHLKSSADAYAEPKDQRHPYVSPVYGDFTKGFPPTLVQGGTREIFLSHFVRLYRKIDGDGGTAVLDLYDGMPHVFQMRPELAEAPETRAAFKKMAAFLSEHFAK
jgi:epsilon-lactone hydrolase